MTLPNVAITRGDIWLARFDPGEGDEIRKVRPAVVMSVPEAGRMRLHIVVPVTGWQPQFAYYFWMRHIIPNDENGLSKESAADTFQIVSVSPNRFQRKLGVLPTEDLQEIAASIALCVGYKPLIR